MILCPKIFGISIIFIIVFVGLGSFNGALMETFRATTARSGGYPVTTYKIFEGSNAPLHPKERENERNYPWRVSSCADKKSYPYPAG